MRPQAYNTTHIQGRVANPTNTLRYEEPLLVAAIVWKRWRRAWLSALVVPLVGVATLLAAAVPAQVLGWIGVVIGFSLAVPQLLASIRNWRRRESSDVSLWTWAMVLVGQALWLSYGVMMGQPTVVAVNIVSAVAGLGVVFFETRGVRAIPRGS